MIVAAYSDYLAGSPPTLPCPTSSRRRAWSWQAPGVTLWKDVLAGRLAARTSDGGPGRSVRHALYLRHHGRAQGLHAHPPHVMHTLVAGMRWFAMQPETDADGGGSVVSRHRHAGRHERPALRRQHAWCCCRAGTAMSRRNASQRYRIASWTAIPTMIQDFFSNPDIAKYDLVSIRRLSGGGAAMPAAVAQRLLDMGVTYYEGYGLSETMAATHLNPPRAREEAMPRNSDLRRRFAGGRSRHPARIAGRRGRRNRHARPAGVPGLLEQARGQRAGPRRDRRQALLAHRRSRQRWTRTAISSWSTG